MYSYDPRFESERMRSVHVIIERSEPEICLLENRLNEAIDKVEELLK